MTPPFYVSDNNLSVGHGLSPLLNNFSIRNTEPKRVYFESSEIITATAIDGFKIGDKRIISITINSGKTTGHYFTVSSPFTFWDNNLIRYEGGSNLEDLEGNKLHNFTLRYISNSIDEPISSIDYFVTTYGNDSNDGLSEDTAWRTITQAGIMATAGSTVWIKAGDYGSENVEIKNSGFYLKPIKFIGYKNTINDNVQLKRKLGISFDNSEMPLLQNGTGAAIECENKSYIIIRNIQVENYAEYGINLSKSTFFIADNIFIKYTKWGIRTIDSKSRNNRIINSYVANSSQNGILLFNKNNLIDNTWAVSSKDIGMDYYLTINGGVVGTNNTIRNSYVHRYAEDSHSGHGICLKGDEHSKGWFLMQNLIENCTIINSKIQVRHRPVKYNVIRNCFLEGNKGISINDGASYNIFENITIKHADYFVRWYETIEDGGMNENGHHNIIKNSIGYDIIKLFDVGTFKSKQENLIRNNSFFNCTFHDIDLLYSRSKLIDDTNKISNCIFSSVPNYGNENLKINITYSNFYDSFKKPDGIGNISINPEFTNLDRGDFTLSTLTNKKIYEGGTSLLDVNYDKNGIERTAPYSMGAFEKN